MAKTLILSVRLPKRVSDDIKRLAEKEDRNTAQVVRRAIKEYLKKSQGGN